MIANRKVLALVAALAGAVLIGACSSSGTGGTGANLSGPASNAPAGASSAGSSATEEPNGVAHAGAVPIKIGLVCSCSGPFGANLAVAAKVAQAWAKSVNAGGGLNGHPIDMTVVDDAGNPGTSVTKVQQLISDEVDVIIDESPIDAAWAKLVTDANIPVVGGNFTAQLYYKNPNFYPSGQTNDTVVYSDAVTMKMAGATTVGQLECVESPQCKEHIKLLDAAAKKVGLATPYSALISSTAPNYTAQCLAAQQAGVDVLFIGASASVIARVATDCHRQGYDPIYATEGAAVTMELATTPGIKDNLWAPFATMPFFVDNPLVQKMNKTVDKYYPGLREKTETWSAYVTHSWTAGLLIAEAVEASGADENMPLSPKLIRKGLDSMRDQTLGGWSPPLTFIAGEPHSVDCWYTARLKNGEPELVNGGKLSCQHSSGS